MSGVRWTEDQLKNWLARGRKAEDSIHSILRESSMSPPKSPQQSKPCSSESPTKERLNKTEQELQLRLKALGWVMLEFQPLTLRIGPVGQRCSYTPDFGGCHPMTGKYFLMECKGAYVYEDARVKLMAAARWCGDRGIGFLFFQKLKGGQWTSAELA